MIQWSRRVNSNKYSQHTFFWRNMENYLNTLICFTAVRQADRIAQLSSSNINRSISSGCFIQHLFQGQIQIFGLGAQTGLGVCVDGGGFGGGQYYQFTQNSWNSWKVLDTKVCSTEPWIASFFFVVFFFFQIGKTFNMSYLFHMVLRGFHISPSTKHYTSYKFQPTIWTTHIAANLNKEITQIYRKNPKMIRVCTVCPGLSVRKLTSIKVTAKGCLTYHNEPKFSDRQV